MRTIWLRPAWSGELRFAAPHPHAWIRGIDVSPAFSVPGVLAVLTANDVKGRPVFGLERADQPVLCWDEVRYVGDPVAIVVAADARTARTAAAKIAVDYETLPAVLDAGLVIDAESGEVRATTDVIRHITVRRGDPAVDVPVVVRGLYEVGMQDPAFLGPESGLAIPSVDGGIDLQVATQSLHTDRAQVAESLGLPLEKARVTLSGVAGAFGGREDISLQIHVCLAALAVGRPVKMTYSSAESFLGHMHRHPAKLWYEHGAAEDGTVRYVKAQILLDGGAYTSTSPSVCRNATRFAAGPYAVPTVWIDSIAASTNNPPAGAMRGFGAVQTCFAYESQMDRLAAAVHLDPVEIRLRNVMTPSALLPTGEPVGSPVPTAKLLRLVQQPVVPSFTDAGGSGVDGVSERTPQRVRGVGYAVGMKNVSGGRESGNLAMATVALLIDDGHVRAEVSCSAADLGQGLSTIQCLIVRAELGVDSVVVRTPSTAFGGAPPSSASRQTWVTGGAVKAACEAVRARVLRAAALRVGTSIRDLRLVADRVVAADGVTVACLPEILGSEGEIRETRCYPRERDDADAIAVAFVAHRAVVDVDLELGTVELLQMNVSQDAGHALDESGVRGQLEGGTVQGLGLAITEELHLVAGRIINPSFDRYLVPTAPDVGRIHTDIVESAQHGAPYGVRGMGEAGTISSGAAVIAAIRAATGRPLDRMPVRPEDVLGLPRPMLTAESVHDR